MLKFALASVVGIGLITSAASADPYSPKVVPAEAKWLLHVDVDALANGPLWKIVEEKLDAAPDAQAKLQEFETFTGMILPQDLHSVTMFGMGFEEPDGVLIFRAKVAQDRLLGILQMNPSYSVSTYGTNEILSWEDKGKLMHGSFFGADQIVMGQNRDNVAKALDTLTGKGAALPAESYMSKPNGAGVTVALASDSVSQLLQKDKKNPLFDNLKAAWVTLSAEGTNITVRSQFNCGNEKAAQQMKAMADGLKAAGMMLAGDAKADPNVKALAPMLPGLQITSQAANIQLEWVAPIEQVKSFIQQVQAAKQQQQK